MHTLRALAGKLKPALAGTCELIGLNSVGFCLQRTRGPFVRAINYHDVSPDDGERFERQIADFSRRFVSVDLATLDLHLRGDWTSRRPGLIITFDDGLRSHYEVVAPILERYGFTGWFFVPAEVPDVPAHLQAEYANRARIDTTRHFGDRIFLSWDEITLLDRLHVIGSHTHSHVRLSRDLPRDRLMYEICDSRLKLEKALGHDVSTFAWVGGEEYSYSTEAAHVIHESGYRFCFMTNNAVIRPGTDPLQLQRTNIGTFMSAPIVGFQLSGILDLLYARKRRRVNRLTSIAQTGASA